jgi:hypothetical protein
MWCCKHCNNNFEFKSSSEKANHSRWCDSNPKKKDYVTDLIARAPNNIGSKRSEETKEKIRFLHRNGHYDHIIYDTWIGRKHSDATKELLRQKALASKHRRVLRKTAKYIKSDGTEILLDSSWEVALANRLDNIKINWKRPEPIEWIDKDGVTHNYFPDFYLVDKNIYLEVKNPFLLSIQKEKMDAVLKNYPNIKIISTLKSCKNFDIDL